jgi:hypothetical protein
MSFIALANRSDLSPSSRPANSFVIGTAVINTHLKPKQPGETAHCRFSGLFIVVFRLQRDGACRYQWENKLLEYFGADCTNSRESDFDKFHFETAKDSHATESEYYNQLWLQMTLFLEYLQLQKRHSSTSLQALRLLCGRKTLCTRSLSILTSVP